MTRSGNPGSRLVFVTGATHMSFSDFPFLLPQERMEKQGQTLPGARAFEMISRTLLAFFVATLGAKTEPKVEDVVTLYPELSLQP